MKVISLDAYRQSLVDNPPEPDELELLQQTIRDDGIIELIINDFGEIKVIHLCKDLINGKWSHRVYTMEEMVQAVLDEQEEGWT